jgi:general secretion pathway protein N
MAINALGSRLLFGAAFGAVLSFGVLADDIALAVDDAGSRTTDAGAGSGSTTPAPEAATSGNPLQSIPISRLSATRDRPLFSASRRPPPPTVVAAPPPPQPSTVPPSAPEAAPFTLVGTIIGEPDRIGIFFNEAAKITTRIREGGRDSGWTLRSLDPRSAVLEGDGRMVTLGMPRPGPTGVVAADTSVGPRISGFVRPRNAARDNDNGL